VSIVYRGYSELIVSTCTVYSTCHQYEALPPCRKMGGESGVGEAIVRALQNDLHTLHTDDVCGLSDVRGWSNVRGWSDVCD
jgi:hypothetical protein